MSASPISDLFAALGDQTRLELIARLASGGPASIKRLSAGAKVTRQAVTKHLHILEDAGVAREYRNGRESIWQLEPEGLRKARAHLDKVSQQWDSALSRLRSFVEND
jgi:DNA-binding transcriptional ArsR family regulator